MSFGRVRADVQVVSQTNGLILDMSAETAPAKKILVVDDNEVILKTISLKLQAAGYHVITALDGAEAVAAVRKDSPDLILLDISFPADVGGVEWDGFRIMAWLHRLEAVKKTPVIIITGGEDAKIQGTRGCRRSGGLFPQAD